MYVVYLVKLELLPGDLDGVRRGELSMPQEDVLYEVSRVTCHGVMLRWFTNVSTTYHTHPCITCPYQSLPSVPHVNRVKPCQAHCKHTIS